MNKKEKLNSISLIKNVRKWFLNLTKELLFLKIFLQKGWKF
jgi:hypothetical protein